MTTTKTLQFTPVWPHGDIQEILPDVFLVTGTNKTHDQGVDIQTSRNMTIVRDGRKLTLINSVRLNEAGLKALGELGEIAHIVRIGAFHGRDDAFYKHQYPEAQLWTLKGMTYDSGLEPDKELVPEGEMPFPNCSLFEFATANQPEGILHVDRDGGVLISCDSIQNITKTDEFYSEETAKSFHEQGLVKPANITPIWLGATKAKQSDFEKLLGTLSFQHLITAHGEPMLDIASEKVKETVSRVFPQ